MPIWEAVKALPGRLGAPGPKSSTHASKMSSSPKISQCTALPHTPSKSILGQHISRFRYILYYGPQFGIIGSPLQHHHKPHAKPGPILQIHQKKLGTHTRGPWITSKPRRPPIHLKLALTWPSIPLRPLSLKEPLKDPITATMVRGDLEVQVPRLGACKPGPGKRWPMERSLRRPQPVLAEIFPWTFQFYDSYTTVYISIYIYIYVYICTSLNLHGGIYIYIYIHTHIHTHIAVPFLGVL